MKRACFFRFAGIAITVWISLLWSGAFPAWADTPDHSQRKRPDSVSEELAKTTGNSKDTNRSKPRIIVFGAHPDDCEIRAGGSAILWSRGGYPVKFVSLTNGDIGHWRMAGGPLAQRRTREVQKAATILGVKTQVLDNHDGELTPTLENRKTFTRLIRGWNADIVIGHRPNDYHPDHRYTGVLMQDSAYMVAVPFFCPDVPPLKTNPIFLYSYDRFQKPTPFQPDIVVAIDDVIERKVDALLVMESQFIEGGALGSPDRIPKSAKEKKTRVKQVRRQFKKRFAAIADRCRQQLVELYGEQAGKEVQYAEAFEICEYGRQPNAEDLRRYFPFHPASDDTSGEDSQD
ncbi:MAG: PIG-L deacetylase family protein [Planctomycetota bacterium]